MLRRLLFVDDEPAIRLTLKAILSKHGFAVTTAATVAEGLQKITSEKFDVLISDLNIGNPGDGLTVVSAMRRTQPDAVTMILTGYPAFETALEAIRQQVDDYIVKPANIPTLVTTIENKLAAPTQPRQLPPPKRVAMLLREHLERVEELWLAQVREDGDLSQLPLSGKQHLANVREIIEGVIRAAYPGSGKQPARTNGQTTECGARRDYQGYTASMMLNEFCLLRRVIAQIIQENLLMVNLSYLIPDLARVNGSLDEQAQTALAAIAHRIDASA